MDETQPAGDQAAAVNTAAAQTPILNNGAADTTAPAATTQTAPVAQPPVDIEKSLLEEEAAPSTQAAPKEGEEVDEDMQNVMKKIQDTTIAPLQAELNQMKKTQSVNDFVNSDEGKQFAPFKEQIMKLASNPKLAGLKVKGLAYLAAGDKLFSMGAEAGRQSVAAAQASITPGSYAPKTGLQGTQFTPDQIRNFTSEQLVQFQVGLKNGTIKLGLSE